jgi:glutathione synthase/RimK-type ligase-like ATP-grasp enzyme
MSRFLGITREPVFSPGRVADDGAILHRVAEELRKYGDTVALINGDDERWPEPAADTIVFAMCQGPRALERMQRWEARGVRIVNRPEGILNCQRHRTVPALLRAGTAFPESLLVETAAVPTVPDWIAESGAWVKRGDVHAMESDDVVFADGVAKVHGTLRRFCERGVERAVVQRHVAEILRGARALLSLCAPAGERCAGTRHVTPHRGTRSGSGTGAER